MAGELSWVPTDTCALPTAEQPLRVAEFGELFAGSLRGVERRGPTWLRLLLAPAAEAQARDLVARETSCCSFFAFDVAVDGDVLVVDTRVPDAHVTVLDGLERQAAQAG